VLRLHARGGLGEVFVAYDEELEREVAFKAIQARYAAEPAFRSRFLLEAKITGGLEHPGVVPVYGLGRDADGRPYYAMRLIRGDSLKTASEDYHREKAGLPPGQRTLRLRQLLTRFVAVCNAVAYAHSRGVLHRDLKPANIMLGKFGETLVVDWGLAKPVGRDETPADAEEGTLRPHSDGQVTTQAGWMIGTPAFMSPEQAAGRFGELGPASDVYSLGATLYAVLTGRPPLSGSDTQDVLRRARAGDFPRPRAVAPEVPAALEAVCLKAMALRPEGRYATALALAGDVEHWLADEPVSAGREPRAARLGRWARRHRPLVAGAAAAAAVALAALSVATVLLSAANEEVRAAKGEVERKAAALAQAKLDAERGRDEATRQRAAAEQNFALARGAVARYMARVAKDPRLNSAGLHQLRTQLLDEAGTFYDQLIRERRDDPAMRLVVAEAHLGYAQMASWLGEANNARQRAGKALELLRGLPAERLAAPEVRLDLATAHDALARAHELRRAWPAAEREARKAQALLGRLCADHPDDRRYAQAHVLGLFELGGVYLGANKPEEAEKVFEQARGLFGQAFAASDRRTHEATLAGCLINLGVAYDKGGQSGRAEKAWQQARDQLRQVVKAVPHTPWPKDALGRALMNLGQLYRKARRLAEAEAAFVEARQLFAGLAVSDPEIPRWQASLVDALKYLSRVYEATGQPGKALEARRTAYVAGERMVIAFPRDAKFIAGLIVDAYQLGVLLLRDGQAGAALPPLTRAIDLMGTQTQKPREGPPPKSARRLLRDAYATRAAALDMLGRNADALKDWDRAVAEDDGSKGALLRSGRAMNLARLGEHARAAADVAAVAETRDAPAAALHLAGVACAVCAGAVKGDAALAERYASRAVALLRRAHAGGYYQVPARVLRLQTNADFDPLRQREDFRKLLAEVAGPPQPPR
jgi:serine/threonine-protein kinase